MKKIIMLITSILFITSCSIEQNITFNEDGTGKYNFSVDMSEFLKMGNKKGGFEKGENIDTLFNFNELIEQYKDSIQKLSAKEQKEIMELKGLEMRIKVDTSSTAPVMRFKFGMPFKKISDLKTISSKISNTKHLKKITDKKLEGLNALEGISKETGGTSGKNEIFDLISNYDTSINSKNFSFQLSKEALKKAKESKKKKKESSEEEGPFKQMFKLKQTFKFPYRIKSLNSKEYKIGSDFKSIEKEISLFDLGKNPKALDVKVEFE